MLWHELRRCSVVIVNVQSGSCARHLPRPTLSEARVLWVTPFPTLSISDAERRAYHNRRVSDAPIHSVSSTRCGFSFAPHPWQVAPRRDPTVLIFKHMRKQIGANGHLYPVAARRDPTTISQSTQ